MKVLVTRAPEDAGVLVAAIEATGHVPVCIATAAFVPVHEDDHLLAEPADVTLLTSVRTVRELAQRVHALPGRVAAVGPATRRAAEAAGFAVEVTPPCATGAAAVAALNLRSGEVVLYPRARRATEATALALQAAGVVVRHAVVYDNRVPAAFQERLSAGVPYDLAVATAGSAVRRMHAVLGPATPPIVVMGPSAWRVAARLDLDVLEVAHPSTMEGLVHATRRVLSSEG